MKNPVAAAVLNIMTFGGGTIYVGKRVPFGIALTIGGNIIQTVEILVSPIGGNLIPQYWPFLIIGIMTTKFALAFDAYQEAKSTH